MNLQSYPNSPLEVLVQEICSSLKNEIQPTQTNQSATAFHCARKCNESTLIRTVQHITKYAPCTVECLGVSLIYLLRMKENSQAGFVNHQTVEQLYVVGVMIASKYYDDLCYNNSVFSRILSIPKPDLRTLEVEYLRRLRFDCSFSKEEFAHLSDKMLHGAMSEKTGYFSLTKRVFELLYPQSKSLTTTSRTAQPKPRVTQRVDDAMAREKWRNEQKGSISRPIPGAAPVIATTLVG